MGWSDAPQQYLLRACQENVSLLGEGAFRVSRTSATPAGIVYSPIIVTNGVIEMHLSADPRDYVIDCAVFTVEEAAEMDTMPFAYMPSQGWLGYRDRHARSLFKLFKKRNIELSTAVDVYNGADVDDWIKRFFVAVQANCSDWLAGDFTQ